MPSFDERSLHPARLTPADVFDEDTTVEEAAIFASDWHCLVIVGSGGEPVAAHQPGVLRKLAKRTLHGTLRDVAPRSHEFLIADISTTLRSLLAQVESFDLAPNATVVVVEESRIRGVSTVDEIQSDLFHVRLGSTGLPGRPKIPVLVRRSMYQEANVDCTQMEQF